MRIFNPAQYLFEVGEKKEPYIGMIYGSYGGTDRICYCFLLSR